MVKTGIVSATFRQDSAEEVLKLAVKAGLDAIEWSSDPHVPPGDKKQAARLKQMCRDNQIEICGYASYYRLGAYQNPLLEFRPILETALELEAPIIRIWAGTRPSRELSGKDRRHLEQEAALLVAEAKKINAVISYECHSDTLTDTKESALCLLNAVPGSKTHWQIYPEYGLYNNIEALRLLSPYITTVHVQEYRNQVYYPLSDGIHDWRRYLEEIQKLPGCHFACLEFVRDGTVSQFLDDAHVLSQLISDF